MRVALKVVVEVAVVATKPKTNRSIALHLATCLLVSTTAPAVARVLPEDRADILYHDYQGGGVAINGPSVLVRKSYKDKISVWGHYYADMISGASVDVEATASAYAETRQEVSLGFDYLNEKSQFGFGATQSREDDYDADTYRVSFSQDFFGDLSSLSVGYAFGSDTVRRNGDVSFEDEATHHSYSAELSQVLTPYLILNFGYESVVDEGYLNNPYRSVRFADNTAAAGYRYQAEQYPRTRTSDAAALRSMIYLPWRASVRSEFRYYQDDWGINAQHGELGLVQPAGDRWIFEFRARYYRQDGADFYADLFPFRDAQNFLARDKELSTFDSTSVGFGIEYTFSPDGFLMFDRGSVNLQADFKTFDYADFSDVTTNAALDDEPRYEFDATVIRLFLSLWF